RADILQKVLDRHRRIRPIELDRDRPERRADAHPYRRVRHPVRLQWPACPPCAPWPWWSPGIGSRIVDVERTTSPVTVTQRLPYTPSDHWVDSTRALITESASWSRASSRRTAASSRSRGSEATRPSPAHSTAVCAGRSIL